MKKLKNLLPLILLFAVNMAFGQTTKPAHAPFTRKDSIMLFGNSDTTMPIYGAPEKFQIGKTGRIVIKPNTTPHYLQDSITKYTQITTYYTIVNNKTKLARYQQILSGFTERAEIYLSGSTKIEAILKELQATKRKLEAEYHIKL